MADIEIDSVLNPMQRAAIPTGIALEIPTGFEGQVRPRSGRALSEGLALVNSPGTIDADYRGEIKVIVINLGAEPLTIGRVIVSRNWSSHRSSAWTWSKPIDSMTPRAATAASAIRDDDGADSHR